MSRFIRPGSSDPGLNPVAAGEFAQIMAWGLGLMRANTIIMIVLAGVFGVLAVVLANIWLADQRSAHGAGERCASATRSWWRRCR